MKTILRLDEIHETLYDAVGGKAMALARVARTGFIVPRALCVSTQVYERFMEASGLRSRIAMEYDRKPFDQMRWEEMWDTALRIQNLFIQAEMPREIAAPLRDQISHEFAGDPVVVRSSALGEDSRTASFAGLHESFVNIRGINSILKHIKLVWASLWSDRAMLYRAEIGLDTDTSRMAVLVQELVQGQKSGVMFGVSPAAETKAVIEAVHGLNEGLVDGTIGPDRWIVDRADGVVCSHTAAAREKMVVARSQGVAVVSLPKGRQAKAPLTDREVQEIYRTGRSLESAFEWPQDMEWTYRDAQLYVLQSRAITTATGISQQDNRAWYLSLHRSLQNLTDLRQGIEKRYIPEMIADAKRLAKEDLATLDTERLAEAIRERQRIWNHWQKVYWDHFIPFAHAVRLFGQVYNRAVQPKNPYEFAQLLPSGSLKSVDRNRRLIWMATEIRGRTERRAKSADGKHRRRSTREVMSDIASQADSSTLRSLLATTSADRQMAFLAELAKVAGKKTPRRRASRQGLVKRFLGSFPMAQRQKAADLLDLAQVSYKLRDDDNIYLGQVEAELLRGLLEAKRRSRKATALRVATVNADQFVRILVDPAFRPSHQRRASRRDPTQTVKARQLVGQPAGEGVAIGPARVVKRREDLLDFKRGEILVCDAVDPNMTFVVPLAAGVVERRGGMLIHGAIIAREYGLPCITGVPDVCEAIATGDRITVDGYLGIVTLGLGLDNPAATGLAKSN